MFLLRPGIDEYVIYEDYDKLIQEWPEDPVRIVHKHNWSIGHTKRHNHVLIVSISGSKGCLLYIIRLHQYLVVFRPYIYWKTPTYHVTGPLDPLSSGGVLILDGHLVQLPVVYTQA